MAMVQPVVALWIPAFEAVAKDHDPVASSFPRAVGGNPELCI